MVLYKSVSDSTYNGSVFACAVVSYMFRWKEIGIINMNECGEIFQICMAKRYGHVSKKVQIAMYDIETCTYRNDINR